MGSFSQTTATGAVEKREFLSRFLCTHSTEYIANKFLYIYGEKNSGKQYYVEEVAAQVFGDDWKSKVYLRIDDGQKYPYKLHAHKVESSVKIICISNSIEHYTKWKALYVNSLLAQFVNDSSEEGLETSENGEAIYKITLVKWNAYNMESLLKFRNRVRDATTECPEVRDKIHEALHDLIREINFLNIDKSQYLITKN